MNDIWVMDGIYIKNEIEDESSSDAITKCGSYNKNQTEYFSNTEAKSYNGTDDEKFSLDIIKDNSGDDNSEDKLQNKKQCKKSKTDTGKIVRCTPNKYNNVLLEQKKLLIKYIESGMTISDAASLCNINNNTAGSIYKTYKDNGFKIITKPRGGFRSRKLKNGKMSIKRKNYNETLGQNFSDVNIKHEDCSSFIENIFHINDKKSDNNSIDKDPLNAFKYKKSKVVKIGKKLKKKYVLSKYKNVLLEQKKLLIKYIESGMTISDAASLCNINNNTAGSIYKTYKDNGFKIVTKPRGGFRSRKLKNGELSIKRKNYNETLGQNFTDVNIKHEDCNNFVENIFHINDSKGDNNSMGKNPLNAFKHKKSNVDKSGKKLKKGCVLSKYRNVLLEQKKLLIKYIESGMTISDAASLSNINTNTAGSIYKAYKDNGFKIITKPRGGFRSRKLKNGKMSIKRKNYNETLGPSYSEINIKHENCDNIVENISPIIDKKDDNNLIDKDSLSAFQYNNKREYKKSEAAKNNGKQIKKRCPRSKYKNILLDQKKLLIRLIEAGMKLCRAASCINMNISTAKSIYKRYKDNDCEIIAKPRGGYRSKKLKNEVSVACKANNKILKHFPNLYEEDVDFLDVKDNNKFKEIVDAFNHKDNMKIKKPKIVKHKQRNNSITPRSQRNQYKSILLEQKVMLIRFIEEGKTLSDAALSTNINLNTAKSIYKRYKENDCEIITKPRGGSKPKKLTEEVLVEIANYVHDKPQITIREIQERLSSKNINISKSTIHFGLQIVPDSFK